MCPPCFCVIRELWACDPHFMRKYKTTGFVHNSFHSRQQFFFKSDLICSGEF